MNKATSTTLSMAWSRTFRGIWPGLLMSGWLVVCCGCGDLSPSAPRPTFGTSGTTGADTSTEPPVPPASTVRIFLDAVRNGDRRTAEKLLTQTAQTEMRKHGLPLHPAASSGVTYQIGATDSLSGTQANVCCRWTEPSASGEPVSHDVAWIVKRTPEGWRIAGFAMPVAGLESPLVVNFEDVDEMIRQIKQAEKTLTASKPGPITR